MMELSTFGEPITIAPKTRYKRFYWCYFVYSYWQNKNAFKLICNEVDRLRKSSREFVQKVQLHRFRGLHRKPMENMLQPG